MPCILILYDAHSEQAYWLYLQAYFEQLENFNLSQVNQVITIYIYISKENIVNQQSIQKFAQYKNSIIQQLKGVIHHEQ